MLLIITICTLLLIAYVFDTTASKTKIPSAILLLFIGWLIKKAVGVFHLTVVDLSPMLPIFGTIGLVLIVLEGSLELEVTKAKLPFIRKTAINALLPIVLLSFGIAFLFYFFGDLAFKTALINAIPFAIISSAVAIPSAQNLSSIAREFVVYESSLSDVMGIVFFNFILVNTSFNLLSIGVFLLDLAIILIVSFLAIFALAYLLAKMKSRVKYLPIILIVLLIFTIAEYYHLPALLFIIAFGLFLANLKKLRTSKLIHKAPVNLGVLVRESYMLKKLTIEFTFLIRALFFILFGYLINTAELFNLTTIKWSAGICTFIFALRYVLLKMLNIKVSSVFSFAPRGLITILLFLNIPAMQMTSFVNKSLIIQVIVLTSIIMMLGIMISSKKKGEYPFEKQNDIET